jgi:hypothetical protein
LIYIGWIAIRVFHNSLISHQQWINTISET